MVDYLYNRLIACTFQFVVDKLACFSKSGGIIGFNQQKGGNYMKKTQHVVHHSTGGWDVKASGSKRATKHFETKAPAIEYGRNIAKNQHTEFFTHGKNGKIQSRDSYGNDPFPPKG